MAASLSADLLLSMCVALVEPLHDPPDCTARFLEGCIIEGADWNPGSPVAAAGAVLTAVSVFLFA